MSVSLHVKNSLGQADQVIGEFGLLSSIATSVLPQDFSARSINVFGRDKIKAPVIERANLEMAAFAFYMGPEDPISRAAKRVPFTDPVHRGKYGHARRLDC